MWVFVCLFGWLVGCLLWCMVGTWVSNKLDKFFNNEPYLLTVMVYNERINSLQQSLIRSVKRYSETRREALTTSDGEDFQPAQSSYSL